MNAEPEIECRAWSQMQLDARVAVVSRGVLTNAQWLTLCAQCKHCQYITFIQRMLLLLLKIILRLQSLSKLRHCIGDETADLKFSVTCENIQRVLSE